MSCSIRPSMALIRSAWPIAGPREQPHKPPSTSAATQADKRQPCMSPVVPVIIRRSPQKPRGQPRPSCYRPQTSSGPPHLCKLLCHPEAPGPPELRNKKYPDKWNIAHSRQFAQHTCPLAFALHPTSRLTDPFFAFPQIGRMRLKTKPLKLQAQL